MNLDEAIQHCEEVARQNEEDAIVYSNCKKYKTNLYEIGLAENAEKKCCKCAEEHRQLAEWLKELKAYREQGGDAISRKHLLEEIAMLKKSPWFNENTYGSKVIRKEAVEIVEDVCIKREPSVSPQQKVGKWELVRYDGLIGNWHCSECRTIIPHMPEETDNTPIYKWCPNCGARMEAGE